MSAERVNSERLPPDLERLEAELGGVRLPPSKLDRERFFFEAGRASARNNGCDCARSLRRERGAWIVALAACTTLALWVPSRLHQANEAPVVSHIAAPSVATPPIEISPEGSSPTGADRSPDASAVASSEPGVAATPADDEPKNASPSRASLAMYSDVLRGLSDKGPDYLRLRNNVVARGVAIGLSNDQSASKSAGESVAYGDLWKGLKDL